MENDHGEQGGDSPSIDLTAVDPYTLNAETDPTGELRAAVVDKCRRNPFYYTDALLEGSGMSWLASRLKEGAFYGEHPQYAATTHKLDGGAAAVDLAFEKMVLVEGTISQDAIAGKGPPYKLNDVLLSDVIGGKLCFEETPPLTLYPPPEDMVCAIDIAENTKHSYTPGYVVCLGPHGTPLFELENKNMNVALLTDDAEKVQLEQACADAGLDVILEEQPEVLDAPPVDAPVEQVAEAVIAENTNPFIGASPSYTLKAWMRASDISVRKLAVETKIRRAVLIKFLDDKAELKQKDIEAISAAMERHMVRLAHIRRREREA